jgi:DNA-binding CsgD family transcriptional regulator
MVQRVASSQAGKEPHTGDSASLVARLSQGQVDCLLLVDQHHSSKEIAVRLGISPHTVYQRIRGAL